MRRPALLGTAVFAVAVVAFAAVFGVPFMTRKRVYPAAITSPPPLLSVALDVIPRHGRLCMSGITIDPRAAVAHFEVGTYGRSGPPLSVELSGAGYRRQIAVAGGYADNTLLGLKVTPPQHSMLLRVCVRNLGAHKVALYSAADVAHSRAVVDIDGTPAGASPGFGFWEGKERSIAQRWPLTMSRIAVFRGPLGYTAVVWLVLALALVALVAGFGAALWRAFSS